MMHAWLIQLAARLLHYAMQSSLDDEMTPEAVTGRAADRVVRPLILAFEKLQSINY